MNTRRQFIRDLITLSLAVAVPLRLNSKPTPVVDWSAGMWDFAPPSKEPEVIYSGDLLSDEEVLKMQTFLANKYGIDP